VITINNIEPGEVVVAALALLGLMVTLSNVGEAMRDLMLGLTGIGGSLVPVVAWNNVRNELLLTTVLTGYLLVGVIGMVTPPNGASEATVGLILESVLFVGTEALIVANSVTNRRDRQLLKSSPLSMGSTFATVTKTDPEPVHPSQPILGDQERE
jgi:hypothetical protein